MPVDTTLPDKVVLSHGNSVVDIYYWGATVTSWKYCGHEHIFLSSKSVLDGSKAIRGGIPLVFPQFGSAPGAILPQHGFARVSRWKWLGTEVENAVETTVRFGLKPSAIPDAQRTLWPFDFNLIYTVSLFGSALKTTLTVENCGATPFKFESLLHTYLLVNDIGSVGISGLTGFPFIDKVKNGARTELEPRTVISIDSEMDKVYERVKNDYISVQGTGVGGGSVAIHKTAFDDVVVWNPWIARSKAMTDFDDNEYHKMVCVEVGNTTAMELAAGKVWKGSQVLLASSAPSN
ncbi:hypothetical protein BASA50_000828 [Batrachochytrium salamandrivorans]|uniref:Glucose-6-phosphate 1-epimerase n=1 Tax=Batrachochytrium salamandrivorans TaxID=1357716 RepID=A0ABQ8ESR9_9FUNG|nr:hypothetical protein BASA62_010168 [Batrachochytrium salamandrivorans]KAH6579694.1 hypothetical protein BASA60_003193 [Batrachochytrium salamandrivorans]KAH6585883.1 hypothetical protein BASA50_000828 [Batrachochytrium salamandrivorans]KAH6593795.1 hypothetical protein BASA61_004186 [Batrachochytrium salamandrivorans]KAH9265737.1 hypothetical protein BASA84_001476 [Batrachochytrium salamandrivorans]